MHDRVVALASQSKYISAREIRNNVFSEFDEKYIDQVTFGSLASAQIINLVNSTRIAVYR
jgi:hypothetical protein